MFQQNKIETVSSIASLAQKGNSLSALSVKSNKSKAWIVNSKASDHMTSASHLFKSYSPSSRNEKVRIANGSFSSIAGKGLVKISKKIDLKSVLYVPKLACNLLYVSKLSKDSNYCIVFSYSYCEF